MSEKLKEELRTGNTNDGMPTSAGKKKGSGEYKAIDRLEKLGNDAKAYRNWQQELKNALNRDVRPSIMIALHRDVHGDWQSVASRNGASCCPTAAPATVTPTAASSSCVNA